MNREAELVCPECGKKQTVIIWESLNISIDPKEKENFLAGKTNFFECSHCDFKSYIPCSFMYHDMERQIAVFYLPEDEIEKKIETHQFTPNGEMILDIPEIGNADFLDYFKKMRITFNMVELINYVRFREKLALYFSTKQENVDTQDKIEAK